MRGRIPLFVLLASSLTFLASLFLPWRETQAPQTSGVQGLLDQFSGSAREIDGWVTGTGDVAVLLVVAVVVATIAALRRPHLAAKLPLRSLAVALAYFAVALAMAIHTYSRVLVAFTGHPARLHASWAYGSYLGLASAGIALLSGLAYRRSDLLRPREGGDVAAGVLGIALLISFFLPWVAAAGQGGYSLSGIQSPAVVIAALGLMLGAGRLLGEGGRHWRLPFALATAVLIGGGASAFTVVGSHRYGTWIGIALAILLVALETVRALPLRLPAPPRGQTAVRVGAAGVLIVALFLPWQEINSPAVGESFDGWYASAGAATGALCLLLLAPPALRKFESYVLDTVVAIVVFVSSLATSFRAAPVYRIGYGAFVGVAAAGILLVTTLRHVRTGRLDRSRALPRALPLLLSVLCVAAVVIPSWFVLPEGWWDQAAALNSWLAVAGTLIGLYLIHLWVLRVRDPADTGSRLTLVPLVLLTLPSLELIRYRNSPEILWSAVILVGLCLLLAVFGWFEEQRGLEGFRVPEEIWRVDRLPEAES